MQAKLFEGIKAVVFDAYGTLFDVNAAVARHADAVGPEAARLSELWRTKQLEYSWIHALSGLYADFWTLTGRALDHAIARCPSVNPALRERLLEAYHALDAYPDARPVLEALRERGLSTAILSNGSPGMLADAVRAADIGPLLDAVLSVDVIPTFKTDPRAYALIELHLDAAPDATLFVSSNRWDVAGAAAFGLRPVWINRAGLPDEYPDLRPVAEVTSLTDLIA